MSSFSLIRRKRSSQLINQFENELTQSFGGCSVIQGTKGLFRPKDGGVLQDRVDIIFTDTDLDLERDRRAVELYVDDLADIILKALGEEKFLIAVYPVYHQTSSQT